jgi:hypothetical protein
MVLYLKVRVKRIIVPCKHRGVKWPRRFHMILGGKPC